MQRIEFLIPGNVETLTGGYEYDRRVAAAMRNAGRAVTVTQIGIDTGSPKVQTQVAQHLNALPEETCVLIDGLALAGLADVLGTQRERLALTALVHHPAALETGLEPAVAERIAAAELRALQAMRRVVCTSAWTAKTVIDSGIDWARVSVVEPGVGLGFDVASQRRNSVHPNSQNGPQLLCVATVTPRKGHELLVDALATVADLPWHLECIGALDRAPQHVARVRTRISEHALSQRIELRGTVSHAQLCAAYARADVFVLASHLEGYGMALAEAHAAALPIVATAGGAVAHTLSRASTDGAAVVVPPDDTAALSDALRRVIGDSEYRQTLTNNARGARPRKWNDAARELMALLDSTAPHSARTR